MTPERPILFSAPMVRAILDGRKTVTRRIVRLPRLLVVDGISPDGVRCSRPTGTTGERLLRCHYGQPGDRLWVRETWTVVDERGEAVSRNTRHVDQNCGDVIVYRADDRVLTEQWRPSIFMPRWASRLSLEVVSVRVERLHDIDDADAWREGVSLPEQPYPDGVPPHRTAFAALWDEINFGRAPWASNPWIWRVEFRKGRRLP